MTVKIWDEDGEEIEKPCYIDDVVNSVLDIVYRRHWRLKRRTARPYGMKYAYVTRRSGSFTIDIAGIGDV